MVELAAPPMGTWTVGHLEKVQTTLLAIPVQLRGSAAYTVTLKLLLTELLRRVEMCEREHQQRT